MSQEVKSHLYLTLYAYVNDHDFAISKYDHGETQTKFYHYDFTSWLQNTAFLLELLNIAYLQMHVHIPSFILWL